MSCQRKIITLLFAASPFTAVAADRDFAGTVDIGAGRKMYLECRGTGSPTVVIVPGARAAADEWTVHSPVFSDVSDFTRTCAYDRPGTALADGSLGRSDPAPMPSLVGDAVADLHALVGSAGIDTPFVIVGHSYGGLVVRLYAMTYPDDVDGMVLVDPLSEFLRSAETPEEWVWQKKILNGDLTEAIKVYPQIERFDPDPSFDQMLAASPLEPMPLVVLSADRPWGPQIPGLIEQGVLAADTPPDIGYVTDRAQKVADQRLAALVPGTKYVTKTSSGHVIHHDNPQIVTNSIREVVAAVRAGRTALEQ